MTDRDSELQAILVGAAEVELERNAARDPFNDAHERQLADELWRPWHVTPRWSSAARTNAQQLRQIMIAYSSARSNNEQDKVFTLGDNKRGEL
jgi:hypothetical protein